ncbi:hypothetical protein SRABI76_00333 [Microbacterium oxydans]|uniref:aggregation-promoting factor C-terminal-like domain-containing protein n=1 Tax=Microbacterium oxydans TaxID=82380 RepID=UPI001D79D376|nr:phospholipase [Microbacterium oxydans]CAH0132433.1 hypothetical protein SRABI76_00333 [Microbacterium oxydans]
MLLLTTITGALLGITLTVGVVSAPAAGAERANGGPAELAATTTAASQELSLRDITDSANAALTEAKAAVTAADTLTAQVAASGLDLGAVPTSIATSELQDQISDLGERAVIPALLLNDLTDDTVADTQVVEASTASLQEAFSAAQAQKAAEDAERAAAEQAAAAAAALAASNTVDGAKATAAEMASSRYGWGSDQFSCLSSLWTKESGWNYQAYNADGGATGIPQALPGSKMASAGSDWQTNAATQIAWGLDYISRGYGTPCSAWSHSQAMNWY